MFNYLDLKLEKLEYELSDVHPYKAVVISVSGYDYRRKKRLLSIGIRILLRGNNDREIPMEFTSLFRLQDRGLIRDFEEDDVDAINAHIKRFMAVVFPYVREAVQTITSYTVSEVKLPIIDCSRLDLDHSIVLERRKECETRK